MRNSNSQFSLVHMKETRVAGARRGPGLVRLTVGHSEGFLLLVVVQREHGAPSPLAHGRVATLTARVSPFVGGRGRPVAVHGRGRRSQLLLQEQHCALHSLHVLV